MTSELTSAVMDHMGLACKVEPFLEEEPEFRALQSCQQDSEWHKEGNVWIHTLLAFEAGAEACDREGIVGDDRLTILLAALLHDIGKPDTTSVIDGRIRAFGHAERGAVIAAEILKRWDVPGQVAAKGVKLVAFHMKPGSLYNAPPDSKPRPRAFRRLVRDLAPARLGELLLVCEADRMGRETFREGWDLVWLAECVREATTHTA